MEKNIKFLRPNDFEHVEDLSDGYVKLKNIKKGDVIYECNNKTFKNIELTALEDAKRVKEGWKCLMENIKGKKIELFISNRTSYDWMNLYKFPLYLEKVGEGEMVYVVE